MGQEEEVVVELPTKADELLDPGSSLVDLAGHQLQLRVGAANKLHLVLMSPDFVSSSISCLPTKLKVD